MKIKVTLLVIVFLGLFFVLYQTLMKDGSVAVSQKEAEAITANLYNGEVLNSKKEEQGQHYSVLVENDKGTYRLKVNNQTGKVSNLKLIERKDPLLTTEEAKGKINQALNGNVIDIKRSGKESLNHAEALVEKKQKKLRVVYDLKKQVIISKAELKDQQVKTSKEKTKQKNKKDSLQKVKDVALAQVVNGKVSNITKIKSENGDLYKVTVENNSEGANVYVYEGTGKISSTSWFSKKKKESETTVDDNDEDNDSDDINDDDDNDNDESSTDDEEQSEEDDE